MKIRSIVEAVHFHAQTQPDALCLADGKQSLSYVETWNRIAAASEKLLRLGVRSGECVMAECTQDSLYSICLLAIQLAGCIFVPLERGASEDRLKQIANETDARFVIGKHCAKFVPNDIHFVDISDFCSEEHHRCNSMIHFPEYQDTAEILFSTGTTGKSKGIELTHANIIAVAENVIYGVEMTRGNVEIIFAPLSHSHGLRRHYANLLFGNAVVFCDGIVFVQNIFSLIERFSVTAIDITPSALKVLFKLSGNKLADYHNQLHYIQLGTAPLDEGDKQLLRQLLPETRLYNFYGSTEAGCSCIIDFNKEVERTNSIGKPTCNCEILIVDEARIPIKASAHNPGLLACRGAMVMKGYWRQPNLTKSVLVDDCIYSNDLAYQDDDGFFYLVGRNDDVINFGGIKISPEEIEKVALRYSVIDECACVAKKDTVSGYVPVLFVTLKKDASFDLDKLQVLLATEIDSNKIPREIHVIEQMPHTYNGKLQRSSLRKTLELS